MSGRFHAGEQAAQQRFGLHERMAEIGAAVIRTAMPDQHRRFFAQLPFVVLGGCDDGEQPWATMLAGPPGFVASPTPTRLVVTAERDRDDPVLGRVRSGVALGLLGIEPSTRRRNRANGVATDVGAAAFAIDVRESFGNCPKYIQARAAAFDPTRARGPVVRLSRLDDAARATITAADTFFLATAHPEVGVDVSHRGGRPGFVAVRDDTLVVPDFTGNFFFNSLGNLLVHPHAGLVFFEVATGELLHVATDAEIVWDGPEVAAYPGAQRLLRLTVRAVIRRAAALALAWGPVEPASQLAATGPWPP